MCLSLFLTGVQLPCTEDIPNCGDTCGKDLACGVHQCQQRCHTGQCDIVSIMKLHFRFGFSKLFIKFNPLSEYFNAA